MKNSKICALIGILLVVFATGAHALDFLEYKQLKPEARKKLIRKYVRKDRDGFWMVSVSVYKVKTTVSGEFTLKMAIIMDDFYKKFNKVFIGGVRLRQKPQLFVLKDRSEYAAFLASRNIDASWSSGMYIHNNRCLVTFKSDHSILMRILFHEGTHQLLHDYIGNRIPIWFNEGMATNFETWDVNKSEMRNVKEALYRSGRARVIAGVYGKQSFIPLRSLMDIRSRQWLESGNPQVQYAAAWSVVNFLLNTEDGRRILNLLIKNYKKGRKHKQMFASGFINTFDKKWKSDLKQRIIPHVRYGYKIMRMINNKNIKQAKKVHSEFIQKHPDNAEAVLLRGLIELREKRFEPALKSLKAAAEIEPDQPDLDYYLGVAYYKNQQRTTAIRFLKKARKEDPGNPNIQPLLDKIRNEKAR